MNLSSSSRIVWITGAGSGIGKSLALACARNGDYVIATGRSRFLLQRLLNDLRKSGAGGEIFSCDVRNARAVERVARAISHRYGAIDLLVNNAGVTTFAPFVQTTLREFDDVLDTNLRGLFLTTRAVLPGMLKRKSGTIVNILSYAAKTTYTKSAAYSAAKAGAEALMNVLRAEVRKKGIQIMNIYPGAILTPMWPAKIRKRAASTMMSAEEFATLVVLLTRQQKSMHVEEIVIRPPVGDVNV